MHRLFIAAYSLLVVSACTADDTPLIPVLIQSWVLDGFDSPESVAPDAAGTFLYVSNVNGGAGDIDGNGYISTISLDGELISREFTTGLNGPKGLALSDGVLYVSDINHLVKIDPVNGDILERVAVEGSTFLNDVTAWYEDGILISDSGTARLYLYKEGRISIWLEDEQLTGVNGILMHNDKLLVVTMDEGELLSIDPSSKEISVLAEGMENADTMAPLDDGGYIVSSWPGVLRHVQPDGSVNVLLNTEDAPIFMNDFVRIGNVIYVPNWQPGTVRAYTIGN